jgi:FkbM family methyltransferase
MDKYGGFKHHYYHCEKHVLEYKHLLENKDIIDVGSNIGFFSLAVCKNFTPKSIHLFEPSAEYFEHSTVLLSDYLGSTDIHFNNYGLDATTSYKVLYKCPHESGIGWNTFLDKDPMQHDTFVNNMNKELCHVGTLDDYKIENVDFIKIDVECYETRVLKGGMKTLAKFKPYLFIEVGWGTNHPEWSECRKIYDQLFDIGYEKVDFTSTTQDILFVPIK